MSKHTPGPWSVRLEDGRGNYHVRECALSESHDNPDIALANARLIAAAPDLLKALAPFAEFARMMDEIEHIKKTQDDAIIHPGLTVGHFRQARAAIAKATGEA